MTLPAAPAIIAAVPGLAPVAALGIPVPDLAAQLLAANTKVQELTAANAGLTEALENSERMVKRVRRNARNSDSTMQDRINVLQNRRG
jgi:hypothetical protein